MKSEKFLTFGNENIFFFEQNSKQDFMAIEPICKFFGADYENELINLKNSFIADEIRQETVFVNDKLESLQFIPVEYIIGWIPTMEIESEKITNYFETKS